MKFSSQAKQIAPGLVRLMTRAGGVVTLDRVLRGLTWMVPVWFLLVLGVAVLDARLEFVTVGRVVGLMVILLGAAGMGAWVWRVVARGVSAVSVARKLEERLGIRGDALVCAVEFLGDAKAAELALVREAIGEAEGFAGKLSPWAVGEGKSVVRAGMVIVLLGMGVGVIGSVFPRFVWTSVQRIGTPWMEAEGYSRAEFAVTMKDSRVEVRVTGAEVARADLVWVSPEGKETRVAMMKKTADEFEMELEGEPLNDEFYIDTPGGRSAKLSSGQLGSKSADQGTAGVPSANGAAKGGKPGGTGVGSGEGAGKRDANAGGTDMGTRVGDEGERPVAGLRFIEEKREATTRPMSEMDRAELKDIPARYRWMVERYALESRE